jgi:hypothetical protein
MGQDLPGADGPEVVALDDGLGETNRSLIGQKPTVVPSISPHQS